MCAGDEREGGVTRGRDGKNGERKGGIKRHCVKFMGFRELVLLGEEWRKR